VFRSTRQDLWSCWFGERRERPAYRLFQNSLEVFHNIVQQEKHLDCSLLVSFSQRLQHILEGCITTPISLNDFFPSNLVGVLGKKIGTIQGFGPLYGEVLSSRSSGLDHSGFEAWLRSTPHNGKMLVDEVSSSEIKTTIAKTIIPILSYSSYGLDGGETLGSFTRCARPITSYGRLHSSRTM
jgi:hypothetical protein